LHHPAPLNLRPYGATEIRLLLLTWNDLHKNMLKAVVASASNLPHAHLTGIPEWLLYSHYPPAL